MRSSIDLPTAQVDPHAWCFLSGRVCALENNLLRREFFENLLPLGEPQEMLACLKESSLGEYFLMPEDLLNFEEVLEGRFFRTLQEARDFSPVLDVWQLVQTRYDLINLKNYLKEKLFGLKRPKAYPGSFAGDTWEAIWEGTLVIALPLESNERALPVYESLEIYKMAINKLKGNLGDVSNNPALLDLIIDATILNNYNQLAAVTGSPFILNYYLEYQKLKGTLFLWRVSENLPALGLSGMRDLEKYIPVTPFTATFPLVEERDLKKVLEELLPERIVSVLQAEAVQEESPFIRYEKGLEDSLMDTLRSAKLFAYGPERVFGYLKAVETETRNLRLAIGGRLNGIPSEQINRRLYKGYV
jgi:hypothetical protein